MPDQAIDLMRGCEAWYDFDPRYYDAQRGVLADKSGYGRHAEAGGGPTVGVEGPASFGATSFDGSDDYFEVTSAHPELRGDKPFSVFCILNGYGDGMYADWYSPRDEIDIHFFNPNGVPRVRTYDGTNSYVIEASTDLTDTFGAVVYNYDPDGADHQLFVNGELEGHVTGTNQTTGKGEHNFIARDALRDGYHDGAIAVLGVFSRQLTMAEVQYLSNLTSPPRSL